MERKLEITRKLEEMGGMLDSRIAILNLPAANYCEKRAEQVRLPDGNFEQSCKGCITQGIGSGERLPIAEIRKIIDYFSGNYGTAFISMNGRGDPFHPVLKEETLEKIGYAASRGIQSYVFTAGNNLDERTCRFLAEKRVNVMISLFGNRFIDAEFFEGKEYPPAEGRIQNQQLIAENIRRLIRTYQTAENQPEEDATRIGMNYVVSENDLRDGGNKISLLKKAATENGIFFISNTNFKPHPDKKIQEQLKQLAGNHSNFHLTHSTFVNGRCQMGAGSSATVDFDGELFRCPYMDGKGDGNFIKMGEEELVSVLRKYMKDRAYICVVRKTRA